MNRNRTGGKGSLRRTTLAPLRRQQGYPRLVASATVARLANEMFPVAVVLYVLERTGSEALAGLTVAAVTFPSVATGPLLGTWTDRARDRVSWLALDQAVSAAALGGILALLAAGGPDWTVPGLALVAGLTYPLSSGGFTALLPTLVPGRLLERANALEAASFNLAMVGGPAVAGTIALAASPAAAVETELALKLAALGLCLGLRPQRRDELPSGTLRAALLEGFRYVWRAAPLLAVTAAGVIGMAGRGLLTLAFPLFAAETLGATEGAAGYLWGALALGSAAGALTLTGVPARVGHDRVVLGSLGFGGSLMMLWGVADSLVSAVGLVLVTGVVLGPGLSATFGVRQRFAPAAMHGHIFMTGASLKVAGFGVGAALAGPAVIELGPGGTLLLAAGLHVLAAGTGALLLLRDRRRAQPEAA